MIIKRQLGEKGQVVIPRDVRQMLGLIKGEEVVFEIINNEVKIKAEQDAEQFVEDFFNTPKLKKKLSSKELKKIILEQYDKEIP